MWKKRPRSSPSSLLPISLLFLFFSLLLFISYHYKHSSTSTLLLRTYTNSSPPRFCTSRLKTLAAEKFLWYAPHSGFSNQLSEFRNAVLMAVILNRTLIVPPALDHHAVALGSCPKFRVSSPKQLRFLSGTTSLISFVLADVMEALVRAKPQLIKEADYHGRTPLYYAASSGHAKTVQRLLRLDTVTAYRSDKEGQSSLHVAASNGHTNVIKVITHHCPNSGELLDLRGRNILHIAVLSGKLDVVRYVLERIDLEGLIDQADNEGNTPLHLAAKERKTQIVRYLRWDRRADPRAKNNVGQRAITVSRSEEIEAAREMQTYKEMGHTLLMVATLIATVTFAAAFTIPGGFNNNVGPNHGEALLQSGESLRWFIISDSVAMNTSMVAACVIFWGSVIAKETYLYYFVSATLLTYIAVHSTAVAFTTGVIAVMPNQPYVMTMCR